MKNTINIFSETGCIQHEVLWKYRQGKLSTAEKHAVEVHLTDCELCSDALAGLMVMENDEIISGLRKSVRKISALKKIIRFYDYRVLTAAAAVVAVFFVFAYMNFSDKLEKKQIAQLTVPQAPKQEPAKDEKPAAADSNTVLQMESDLAAKPAGVIKEKANGSYVFNSAPSGNATWSNLEDKNKVADADRQQEETTVTKNITFNDDATSEPQAESGYSAPAPVQVQSAAKADDRNQRLDEKATAPVLKSERKKSAAPASTKDEQNKYLREESSSILYISDLKVSRTPAFTEAEKLDTVNPRGTPAMYETVQQKAADAPPAEERPFVYSQTLRKGMEYFHNKQYEYASQMFSVIMEHFPNDVNAQFYKGLSEMELHNYVPSSELLNKAMLNSDKTFYEEAKFKLALCYISLNQKDNAKKLLEEIVIEKGFYSKQASQELQRLK